MFNFNLSVKIYRSIVMKEMNFYGCESLSMNEAMVIEGGDAYEAGYAIGKAIRDFGEGLWDGLCGK